MFPDKLKKNIRQNELVRNKKMCDNDMQAVDVRVSSYFE